MDETFIKMCVAGQHELRKNWTPKAGNRVLTRWNSNRHKIEIDYYSKDFITKEASVLLHKSTDVWLPRQEDLQEICKKFPEELPYPILEEFIDWINNSRLYETTIKLNELWFCFVMETCYNKKWNLETEKWEVIQ